MRFVKKCYNIASVALIGTNSFGWVAEWSNATVLLTSQQGKRSTAERERMVSSTVRCEKRTKPQVERPAAKEKFRMGGRVVECDGLENR